MFRNFGWKFWVIGILAAIIIGVPVATKAPINLGLDLQGGTMLTYELKTESERDFQMVLEVLQNRVDTLGMRSLVLRKEGPQHFVVQVPGVDTTEIESIKRLIGTAGKLDFLIVAREQDEAIIKDIFDRKIRLETYDWTGEEYDIALRVREDTETGQKLPPLPPDDPASYTLLENKGRISGRLLANAYPIPDELQRPAVGFQWGAEGANLFGKLTEDNLKRNLAIVLDGEIQSAPVIQERIGAMGRISGDYSWEEVNDLVVILKGGSLPTKPVLEGDLTVGPGLGRDSVERGKLAVWISLALVILFTVVYYRGPGLVATGALILNLVLLVCVLILFEATLTLPGIAGIVLTVGMAIDANILIFERIREEKNKGMGIRQAVENGYSRAFSTIFDANLTTLITALILFQVGTGPIKGFAVTLSIGIITSVYTALFVTKAFFALLFVKGWMKEFAMMTLVQEPKIPFLSYWKIGLITSAVVILGGMSVFFSRGGDKYGIEFTGGAVYQMKFNRAIPMPEVRSRVAAIGPEFRGAEVQAIGLGGAAGGTHVEGGVYEVQVRVRMISEEGEKIDLNVLRPPLEGEFREDLAPDGFPDLPPRDAIQKERIDSTQGKVAVLVRLDPRVQDLGNLAALQADLRLQGPLLAECVVEAGPEETHTKSVRVTTGLITVDPGGNITSVRETIREYFRKSPDYPASESFPHVQEIGSAVAYNLKSKAILALVFAVVAIVLYITFRFEFKFGLAAIVALVHDVLVAMGVVAVVDTLGLLDLKIDLAMVTAFLTIIGYSLNDTIVVFDRIRENLGGRKKMEYRELIDASINQTLARTLLTSLTTFVALLALFLAGVNVIRDFSFAMIIGVVVGTYSSIFIASPVLLFLRNREVTAVEREMARTK